MEWALVFVLLIGGFFLLRDRRQIKNAQLIISNMQRKSDQTRAADNALVLAILAREIANELMQRDAESYRKNFERLYEKWQAIEKKNAADKLAHAQIITSKYATFLDFDELGTKAHVLYADGFSWKSDDDLWGLYESIRLYDALNCNLDEEWRRNGAGITEKELEHLNEYCKKLSDTKLLAHLHKAREQLWFLKNSNVEGDNEGDWLYETIDYKIRPVPHFAESRWGVYVKKLDRYGMWGVFVDEVAYTSFYAADENFEEDYLDNLHIRICADAKEYERIEVRR